MSLIRYCKSIHKFYSSDFDLFCSIVFSKASVSSFLPDLLLLEKFWIASLHSFISSCILSIVVRMISSLLISLSKTFRILLIRKS